MLDITDYVKVGDPDPTPILEEEDCCLSMAGRWSCTRADKHPGQHVAGDSETVCAVWT